MTYPIKKFNERVDQVNSLLCLSLDPDFEKLPERFKGTEHPQFEFNKYLIEETHAHISAYKFNAAFYEARGDKGLAELKMTVESLKERYPNPFTISDAKRGDIENTNRQYAISAFDWLGCDAVTLQPYAGGEPLAPFLERRDKVSFILCRTSNPGAVEFQDALIDGAPLWQVVAKKAVLEWNKNGNCGLVVGATYPNEVQLARAIAPNMMFLVPGVGAQGGDLEKTVQAGVDKHRKGLIIVAARSIIFDSDPGQKPRALKEEINSYR